MNRAGGTTGDGAAPNEQARRTAPPGGGEHSVDDAGRLVVDAFARHGEHHPRLVRDVSSPVWMGASLVAKVHGTGDSARREQAAARAFSRAGCRVAAPLGVDYVADRSALSWWRRLPAGRQPACAEIARWLRAAHDNTPPGPVPSALELPDRTPHCDATNLHHALRPWVRRAGGYARHLRERGGNPVMVHGDANPTNFVSAGGSVYALDFGLSGYGPRVLDVATVTVLAVETGQSRAAVLDAYGPSVDVDGEVLEIAERLVAINRAVSCTWVPWLQEGWDRLGALECAAAYVFPTGDHPK